MLPKSLRKESEIIVQYADALVRVNAKDRLQPLLTKALNNDWHPDLIDRFGAVQTSKPEKQLATAEKWLSSHAEDASLLLALGRICRRLDLLGKARDYLTSALAFDASPEHYLELAEVLTAMGDHKASAKIYRQGLQAGFSVED